MKGQIHTSHILLLIPLFLLAFGCVHEYETVVGDSWLVEVNFSINDPEYWPDNQSVKVGVFEEDDSKTPYTSVTLSASDEADFDISLGEVPEGKYYVKLYLTENGVYKVAIQSTDLITIDQEENIVLDDVTLLSFDRIQNQIFSNCQLCHGGSSGELAADLNLTKGNSYSALVNVAATNYPAMVRVLPGSANYSYLLQVMDKDIDFDHAASSSVTDPDRTLIVNWINAGAKEN